MRAYYNEIDGYCAEWLRNLIAAGHIAPGDVDERSIVDVRASDLAGYTQCHFFAGIGGWSLALRLAGWSDDRPVWTGSCPCQPFSAAGKRAKQSDERHLWPDWHRLIVEQRPRTIFGEQVDDALAAGWLDDALLDLESASYACAASILPACSVAAPHERQRIFFVANHIGGQQRNAVSRRQPSNETLEGIAAHGSGADAERRNTDGRWLSRAGEVEGTRTAPHGDEARPVRRSLEPRIRAAEVALNRCTFVEAWQGWNGGFGGFGRLDDGIPKGVAKRVVGGFGNAIVPQVAAEFIAAFLETEADRVAA